MMRPAFEIPFWRQAIEDARNGVSTGENVDELSRRVNQLDARVSKVVRLDRLRVQLNLDAFNLLNANPVLAQRNVYGRDGATWQRPELVLPARLVKVGFNIAF